MNYKMTGVTVSTVSVIAKLLHQTCTIPKICYLNKSKILFYIYIKIKAEPDVVHECALTCSISQYKYNLTSDTKPDIQYNQRVTGFQTNVPICLHIPYDSQGSGDPDNYNRPPIRSNPQ